MSTPGNIRFTQWLAQPPETVWTALTDPTLHAKWLAAGDIRPQVGHQFSLDMGQWGQQACEVVAVEPYREFAFRFATGKLDTTVTWTLAAERDGTQLTLNHSGFKTDSLMGNMAYQGMRSGWPKVLERLVATVSSDLREAVA